MFNSLLKNLKQIQHVMLNWFQHLVESTSQETLNQVQGDKEGVFQRPIRFLSKGFTLIEIIIVIVILSIVSVITVKFLVDSLRIYTMAVNQKVLYDEAKSAMERMCRDIRDARTIDEPDPGVSDNAIRFRRTNATGRDAANEWIVFQLTGTTLEKDKANPNRTVPLASNVSAFTVTRGEAATNNLDEITLLLELSLASGENVTLRTKVYPKNLSADPPPYKNFRIREAQGLGGEYASWREVLNP